MGGGVGVAADVSVVVDAEDAVLGREEGGEGEAGDEFGGFGVEEVDGAVGVGVEAGLVGEEAEFEGVIVIGGQGGEGGVVGGLQDVYASLGLNFTNTEFGCGTRICAKRIGVFPLRVCDA